MEFNEIQFLKVYREKVGRIELLIRLDALYKPHLPMHLTNDLFYLQVIFKKNPCNENFEILEKRVEAYGLKYNVSSFL